MEAQVNSIFVFYRAIPALFSNRGKLLELNHPGPSTAMFKLVIYSLYLQIYLNESSNQPVDNMKFLY